MSVSRDPNKKLSTSIFANQAKIVPLSYMIDIGNFEAALKYIKNKKLTFSELIECFTIWYELSTHPARWLSFFSVLSNLPDYFSSESLLHALTLKIIRCHASTDKSRYGMLLSNALRHMDNHQQQHLLQQLFYSKIYHPGLMSAITTLERTQLSFVAVKLIPMCIRFYNPILLHMLKALDSNTFQKVFDNLEVREKNITTMLLTMDCESNRTRFTHIMSASMPFPGHITYQGGLLTCAQIRARKKNYLFNPTVLNGADEFNGYVDVLRMAEKPARERFIITGGHWITGDVQIDSRGRGSLLLIDPLGYRYSSDLDGLIRKFAAAFPENQIFISKEKRQFDHVSCQIFSLDDIQHLFTIEKYLAEKFRQTGLFGYLSDQVSNQTICHIGPHNIFLVNLPLPFLRTTQAYHQLMKAFIDRSPDELKLPVNKKREVLFTATNQCLRPATSYAEKDRNIRIRDKWNQMIYDNACFVQETGYDEAEKLKQDFSLTGFQKKHSTILSDSPLIRSKL